MTISQHVSTSEALCRQQCMRVVHGVGWLRTEPTRCSHIPPSSAGLSRCTIFRAFSSEILTILQSLHCFHSVPLVNYAQFDFTALLCW